MAEGEALTTPLAVEGEMAVERPGPVALLYAELSEELRKFVQGVVRDPEVTDDIMQTVFVKAIEHGHEARAETSRGWLFRVAFHEALAARRRLATIDKAHRVLARVQPKAGEAPDDRLLLGETVEAVRKSLKELPEEQRRVVLARIYQEKTFAEIASEFQLPLGTVLTRMRRALEKMRRQMSPGG